MFYQNAEISHALLPGWYEVLRRIATQAAATPRQSQPRIVAINWPKTTTAGVGGGQRALPYCRTRELARPGLTLQQCAARGASPKQLRRAVARGYIVLEASR
jgi:hypothetical protein